MQSQEQKKKLHFFLITSSVISLLVLTLQFFGAFDVFELRWYGHLFTQRGPLTGVYAADSTYVKSGTDVVLVDVDAEAWRTIPESWPYSRSRVWSDVVKNLSLAGARMVVFDIQFDTPDTRSEYLRNFFAQSDSSHIRFSHGDSLFAQSIIDARKRGTAVILPSKIALEPSTSPPEYIALPVPLLHRARPTG